MPMEELDIFVKSAAIFCKINPQRESGLIDNFDWQRFQQQ